MSRRASNLVGLSMEVPRSRGSFNLRPTAEMESFMALAAFTYSNPEIPKATSNPHEKVAFTVSVVASINKLHGCREYILESKSLYN